VKSLAEHRATVTAEMTTVSQWAKEQIIQIYENKNVPRGLLEITKKSLDQF
jgi:hypothetical protein